MKSITLPSILALTVAFAGSALALTPFADNFDAKKLNNDQWYLYKSGQAKLSQNKGVLNLLSAKAPKQDEFSTIELLGSYPGVNEDWQFTLDLQNTSGAGDEAGCGFMIFHSQDRSDYLWVEFYGKSGIAGGALANGKPAKTGSFKSAGVPNGSIKVAYSKTTKLMTFYVAIPEKGKAPKFIKIGNFSPTGSGGDVRAKWDLKSTDQFGIQLLGFSKGAVVKAGKVTLDNFDLSPP